MCGRVQWALLLCGLCFLTCAESQTPEYHFVNEKRTWPEAQQFCRQHYSDLATVSSAENTGRLPRASGYGGPVWIGLYDDPSDLSSWRWSATGSAPSYSNWSADHPIYYHSPQHCMAMKGLQWYSTKCFPNYKYLCMSGSNPSEFHLETVTQTWDVAKNSCRTIYSDLAVIESEEDRSQALALVPPDDFVWVGLHRTSWRWSDNTPVSFTNWLNLHTRPSLFESDCAAEAPDQTWSMFECQEEYPFYCQGQGEPALTDQKRGVWKIQFSGSNLDSAFYEQLSGKIRERFKEAEHTDAKIKWKTPPKKKLQKKKTNPEECPQHM